MADWQTETATLEEKDLERWAAWLKERRLETPAGLALESLKPLHNLIYQMLVFSSPMIEVFGVSTQPALKLWEDPTKLEGLMTHLESVTEGSAD